MADREAAADLATTVLHRIPGVTSSLTTSVLWNGSLVCYWIRRLSSSGGSNQKARLRVELRDDEVRPRRLRGGQLPRPSNKSIVAAQPLDAGLRNFVSLETVHTRELSEVPPVRRAPHQVVVVFQQRLVRGSRRNRSRRLAAACVCLSFISVTPTSRFLGLEVSGTSLETIGV